MKITHNQLRKIIYEELSILKEVEGDCKNDEASFAGGDTPEDRIAPDSFADGTNLLDTWFCLPGIDSSYANYFNGENYGWFRFFEDSDIWCGDSECYNNAPWQFSLEVDAGILYVGNMRFTKLKVDGNGVSINATADIGALKKLSINRGLGEDYGTEKIWVSFDKLAEMGTDLFENNRATLDVPIGDDLPGWAEKALSAINLTSIRLNYYRSN